MLPRGLLWNRFLEYLPQLTLEVFSVLYLLLKLGYIFSLKSPPAIIPHCTTSKIQALVLKMRCSSSIEVIKIRKIICIFQIFLQKLLKIAQIYITSLFCGFKNVIFDVSKYSKYTNNGAQYMRGFSKQISKKIQKCSYKIMSYKQ